MTRVAAPLLLLLLLGLAAAAPVRVALPDGRRMALHCTGTGSPTVVLEAGFLAWSFAWAPVQPALAKRYRVCSYDRAGLGGSDPGPLPRDGAAIAADLDALLKAASVPPPYLLVGHSAGGLYVRLLAERRPGQIAGMVLVDPSVEWQFRAGDPAIAAKAAGYGRCATAAAARALPSSDPALSGCWTTAKGPFGDMLRSLQARPSYWATLESEYRSLPATAAEIAASAPDLGDLPLIVLTAGARIPPDVPNAAAIAAQSIAAHEALARKSTRGVAKVVPGAGHIIMRDNPAAVIAAVDSVAAAAR